MADDMEKINIGDYIILQRQKYTKLHKFGSLESTAMLGKEQLELRNIEGQSYCSTFKMIPKEGKGKRVSTLEICSEADMPNIRQVLGISECGVDNRNITDDGGSQNLKAEEISKLRDECTTSSQILEKIVENSRTFNSKTEYSQEKYLKKKEKKYFEYVQVRQPSVRLLTEIYFRQDPDKIMGIRMDTLSQIITYSGVSSFGNFLMYESGTNGLLPAAFVDLIGSKTEAQLVHMHPGNVPQRQAILALNIPEEQMNRCISVNIYSVLREFYQGSREQKPESEICQEETSETPCKKLKLEEQDEVNNDQEKKRNNPPKWQIENKRACDLMKEKFDSLVVAAREHPLAIIKGLLPFVKPSSPVVIFNLSREILMEIYVELKATTEVTNLHLTSNWMRMYQILPNRTHPEVQMFGNSGYLLCGYTIR